jgi:catechol 2,3-dioxygenase-like lactoylglutathione lyase family enzyme
MPIKIVVDASALAAVLFGEPEAPKVAEQLAIGWRKLGEGEFGSGSTVIYFVERAVQKADTLGPRHVCFQATSRNVVDAVGKLLTDSSVTILRGPVEMADYSAGYYTVDFRDPDGYVLEVAHTPNMTL